MKKKNLKRCLMILLALLFTLSKGYCESEVAVEDSTNNISQQEELDLRISENLPQVVTIPIEKKQETDKTSSKKQMDLNAVMFNPDSNTEKTTANAEAGNEESLKERLLFQLHEALFGELKPIPKLGLLENQMKMKFEEGPISSLSPYFEYTGSFANIWDGPEYENTLYNASVTNLGINGKFRDNKTVFRLACNPGIPVAKQNYIQGFVTDVFVMRNMGKHHKLLIGNSRNPIGVEGYMAPYDLPLLTRSQIARNFSNTRALGTKLQGDYKYADYVVGLFSSGRNFHDWFPGPEVSSWVNVKPLAAKPKYGKVTLGTGLNAGNYFSPYSVVGAYAEYEYKRLKTNVEYSASNGSNGGTGFTDKRGQGVAATVAYRLTPKIQLIGRYDVFDKNVHKLNDRRTEYTAGLSYYLKGQDVKLMMNYVYYSLENGNYGSRLLTGTQLRF